MNADERTGVAAVAGRRIDAEDATERRFPSAEVERVKDDLRQLLTEHHIGTLVCSAACGTDIVALEAAVELGLHLVIVLPFEPARFRTTSVVDRGGDWGERFDELLGSANPKRELIVLEPTTGSESAAYAQATRCIIAEAQKRAPTADSAVAIAVWEGQWRAGTDETQDFIDQAKTAGLSVRVVISSPAGH
jgi:hypothetical protein